MIWITILLLICYLIMMIIVLWDSRRTGTNNKATSPQANDTNISIIVPVRNEEQNIYKLLESIYKNAGKFEVLVVNDHSDDLTVDEVERFISDFKTSNIQVLELDELTNSPKKAAISIAIQQAKGEFIVTTDGDCIVPEHWLSSIRDSFCDTETQMVLGGVYYGPTVNLFERIQAYELAAIITLSLSRAKVNKPFTCNGANLAYSKKAFFEVGGFSGVDQIASGDDELLMKKFIAHFPKGVAVQEHAFVATLPNKTVKQLFNQRIRWASKWKYGTWKDKLPGAFLLVMYLSLIFIPVAYFDSDWNGVGFLLSLALIFVKYQLDKKMIHRFSFFLKMESNKRFIPTIVLFLIYPLYVVFFGLSATFLKFSWKGRKLK
jgi:cellulose synthase/poly-beta-1,6-N-acetylglucosamine synthase-like glycosyltransferase